MKEYLPTKGAYIASGPTVNAYYTFTINNKFSANKVPFNPTCLAAKRVRDVLVFSDMGMPGTEAMAAEWYHLKSHRSPV